MTQSVEHFNMGVKEGDVAHWRCDGQKSSEGTFHQGREEGTFRLYGRDERLCYEKDFRQGVLLRWREFQWYESGSPKAMTEHDPSGGKEGRWITWHPNGVKAAEGSLHAGYEIGFWKYWYANGKLRANIEYSLTGVVHSQFWDERGEALPLARYRLDSEDIKREFR